MDQFNFKPFNEGSYDISPVLQEHIGHLMGQTNDCGGLLNENSLYESLSRSTTTDALDEIRADASEDFEKNGVERELDILDWMLFRRRNSSGCSAESDRPPSPEPSPEPEPEYVTGYKYGRRVKKIKVPKTYCVFCKNNGEMEAVYKGHIVKDVDGKVLCPILRNHTCPVCFAKGDDAHTIRYCTLATELRLAAYARCARRNNRRNNPRGADRR